MLCVSVLQFNGNMYILRIGSKDTLFFLLHLKKLVM